MWQLAQSILSICPPPSHAEKDNLVLLEQEAEYCVELLATTFILRREAVDSALPLGRMPLLFNRTRERSEAPLFHAPGLLHKALEEVCGASRTAKQFEQTVML